LRRKYQNWATLHEQHRADEDPEEVVLPQRYRAQSYAKDARDERDRQEERGHDGEALHDLVHAVGDRRKVRVERTAHQLAIAVHRLEDADQVIVHVAEVALQILATTP
jgi:hypothetical protein